MASSDYFEVLELPRNLGLDSKELEKKFFALSRKHHPDLHARKGPGAVQQAEETTALLNDAYRTLRDPIARSEYLLKTEGFEALEANAKNVPPELLEEVFELNMALEELRDGDTDVLPQLKEMRGRFVTMRGEIDEEMGRVFHQWDSTHERGALTELRALLNRRKYISNLITQTDVSD